MDDSNIPTNPYLKKLDDGIFYRKLDCNSIFLSVVPGKSVYFHGKCSVKVLKGVVDIYGCQLTSDDSKRSVFSPKGHSLLCITSLASESEMDCDMAADPADVDLPDLTEESAIFVMEVLENEWCEGFRSYCPEGESLIGGCAAGMGSGKLPKLNEMMSNMGFQLIPRSQLQNHRVFTVSPLWDEILYSLQLKEDVPRLAIFGGKGVGKSTFFRWAVNKCLSLYGQSVLCVDLDPGQAEFTPPGFISAYLCRESLLGPNYTYLCQPLKSVFLGSVDMGSCPTTYVNALKSLHKFLQEEEGLTNIPWIINTMGFCLGLGVNFACEVVRIFEPRAVIQITIKNPQRSFPFYLDYKNVSKHQKTLSLSRQSAPSTCIDSLSIKQLMQYDFFKIESVCNTGNDSNKNPWGAPPKDLRRFNVVSYFANLIGSTNDCNFLSIVPRMVRLDNTAVGTMNSDLSYENILRTINGNLVALCEFPVESLQSLDSANKSSSSASSVTRKYIQRGLFAKNYCYGYGVVRGMDAEKGLLYVVTPVSSEILESKVNAIICAGAIDFPVQFRVNGVDENGQEIPYVMAEGKSKTKLDRAARKQFNYKRATTQNVLKNCLL